MNRVVTRTGTRPPPFPSSTPCPYRTAGSGRFLLFHSGYLSWLGDEDPCESQSSRTNRGASRTGTRPPPVPSSTPCPYRTGDRDGRPGRESHYPEILHTEQLTRVRPDAFDGKACGCRQLCKLLERILVRALRPDAFAQLEGDINIPNVNRLVFQTHQVHLDPTLTRIIEGIVPKLIQLEVGVQFLVHAH